MQLLYQVLLVVILMFGSLSTSGDKRLLLNEPDAIGRRLDQLETTQKTLVQQVQTLQQENTNLRNTVSTLRAHGSTYIRWGRSHCTGSNTETVYKGYAAGQYYAHSGGVGGPANMLCLPDNPEIQNVSYTYRGIDIYGTEYETDFFGPHSSNEDVPCALCRNTVSSTSVMFPGRQTCYQGWSSEYIGVLAAGSHSHTASEYICVDKNPEYLVSGKASINGHLLYVVNTKCGPLPCPPYEEDRKINCVVCSK